MHLAFGSIVAGTAAAGLIFYSAVRVIRRRAARAARMRATSDFVYVVEGGNNLVKVGISTNPEARLATLQTGSGVPLSMAYRASSSDAFAVEQRAHRMLSKHRLQGEWFDCSAEAAIEAVRGAARQLGVKMDDGSGPDRLGKAWWWLWIAVFALVIVKLGQVPFSR